MKATKFEVENGKGIPVEISVDPESTTEVFFRIEQDYDVITLTIQCLKDLIEAAERLK